MLGSLRDGSGRLTPPVSRAPCPRASGGSCSRRVRTPRRQEPVISTSTALSEALTALVAAAQVPRRESAPTTSWRWSVRQRMTAVRDALMQENSASDDGWLAARGGVAFRERNALLARLGDLGTQVLENPDIESLLHDVGRLVTDVSHHLQRVNDIAYDEVELELGGSE